jgi:Spy/CpxP family protein refolding chaperone
MSDESKPARRFGFIALFTAVVLGLVGGGFATSAFGHGGPRHWGGHGGGWGHHRMHGPMDPEHAQRHVERMVGRLAWAVDATAEQKQKLTAIAESFAKDMQPLHQKMHEAHKRGIEILRQPAIDRAAIEAFRAEQIAGADAASKRLAQALADAAEVLTPQQRAKLAQRWDF